MGDGKTSVKASIAAVDKDAKVVVFKRFYKDAKVVVFKRFSLND